MLDATIHILAIVLLLIWRDPFQDTTMYPIEDDNLHFNTDAILCQCAKVYQSGSRSRTYHYWIVIYSLYSALGMYLFM